MYLFLACEWREEGTNAGQNLFFQTKITAKLQLIPCKLINLLNCCWSFSRIWFFLSCFIQAGFAGRSFCNRSTDTALTSSAEPWSRLEVASSPSKWETEGNTDAGDAAPCRDLCPTSNLASGYRATRAALWVRREEEEDSEEEGKEWQQENNQKTPWESGLLFLPRKKI